MDPMGTVNVPMTGICDSLNTGMLLELLNRVQSGERPSEVVSSVVGVIQSGGALQPGRKPPPEPPEELMAWKAPAPHTIPTRPNLDPGYSHRWQRLMSATYETIKEALAALDKVMKNRTQAINYPNGTHAYLCHECEKCCFLVRLRGSDERGYYFEVTGHSLSCEP